MLCCHPTLFAKTIDEVVIDDCRDVYEFKVRKGEIIVNNKITLNYELLKQFKCKIQPSIFYGDNIKFGENPEHFQQVTDMIDAKLFGLFS